jgi:putative transposase
MARQVRFRVPNIPQHIVHRGHNGTRIFYAERDYKTYLDCLADAAIGTRCPIHAYVLLPNRVEILCTATRGDGVAKLMQAIGRRYVPDFNSTHGRTGTLWDGRYRAALIEPTGFVLTLYRYLDTLPTHACLTAKPGSYRWSSYRAHARGDANAIVTDHVMYLGLGPDARARQARYSALCDTTLSHHVVTQVEHASVHGLVLGSSAFQDRIARSLGVRVRLGRPGRPRKHVHAPPLQAVVQRH